MVRQAAVVADEQYCRTGSIRLMQEQIEKLGAELKKQHAGA